MKKALSPHLDVDHAELLSALVEHGKKGRQPLVLFRVSGSGWLVCSSVGCLVGWLIGWLVGGWGFGFRASGFGCRGSAFGFRF